MIPFIDGSLFARTISSRSASPPPVATGAARSSSPCQAPDLLEESFVQTSITSTPISFPYCFFRLTYLVMTRLSESRRMRSLGVAGRDLT